MDRPEATRVVTVTNPEGFHLRAATVFVSRARQFDCAIELAKGCRRADGKSTPLQLLALGAGQGDELRMEAAGVDAETAIEALVELFTSNFGEEIDDSRVEQSELGQGLAEDERSAG